MLSDVTILITAGSRRGYLENAIAGIKAYLPECQIVIVNDDESTPIRGTIWKEVPYDTWLTKKRNIAASLSGTKYSLMAADDFDFTIDARATVIRMVDILDTYTFPDVIAGTFNNRRYEGYLEVIPGEHIREHRLNEATDIPFQKGVKIKLWKVDIAANWFLARTRVLRQIPWDETIGPIGGEHADWFLDVKAAGKTVVWTPGLNINEQEKNPQCEATVYSGRRRRVWEGHNLMLKKRGVKYYIGFDGQVSKENK